MAGSADFVQRFVHLLEAGSLAGWIKRGLVVVLLIGLGLFYFMHEFKGLATSQAMDQAQEAREMLRHNFFKTKVIRPRALGQLEENGKNVLDRLADDTYNAPLPVMVDACALELVKAHFKMGSNEVLYPGDKAIAIFSIALFLLSLFFVYLTALRLFDQRIALLGCGLVLVCDMMWQYSLSGLPQMLMLLLFNATIYAFVRAAQVQQAAESPRNWLAAAAVGFGLLALTHALTIFIFVAALIFVYFFFRPRISSVLMMLVIFVVMYAPWMVRTYVVSGTPGGVAIYSILDGLEHPEAGHMRRIKLDLGDVGPGNLRSKIVANVLPQVGRMLEYFGWSLVAPVFFVGLLHVFRKPETRLMQWMILALWGGAFLGISIYGMRDESGFGANQLHLLFMPIMTCYGLAFLLVQWNRLGIENILARWGFLTGLYVISAVPMIFAVLFPTTKVQIRWPPYLPPYITVLNDWMEPDEIIASDVPCAIAWYADRESIWLPESPKLLGEISDYRRVGGSINGLYLTPVSGGSNTLVDVWKGEYKDWAQVVLRQMDLAKFPLHWATLLGVDEQCAFYSDHDRAHKKDK